MIGPIRRSRIATEDSGASLKGPAVHTDFQRIDLPRPVAAQLENRGQGQSHSIWTGNSKPGTVSNY